MKEKEVFLRKKIRIVTRFTARNAAKELLCKRTCDFTRERDFESEKTAHFISLLKLTYDS